MSTFSRATSSRLTSDQPIIKANSLTKIFGELGAVDGIDFEVMPGEIFGMLGPNGAGKTTTMRMISCISPVTSGELYVDGLDVSVASRLVRDRIGVVAQHDGLDPDLKVEQNLVAYARYFGMNGKRAVDRAREMLGFFDLSDRSDDEIHSLSGGMRRRLSRARAFMTRPRTVILDEPSMGFDPHSRNRVWDQLGRMKDAGATILMSTHYMEEAAALCDRLIIMDLGRILASGTPDEREYQHSMMLIFTLIGTPIFFFSGAFSPIDSLNQSLQPIAWVMPLTGGVHAARGLSTGEFGMSHLYGLIYMIGLAAAFYPASFLLLRRKLVV